MTRDGRVTGQANELYDAEMKRVARDLDGVATYYVFDGEKIARVEQPEAGMRDFYIQEGQSIYSPLVSVHDEAADAQYWYLFDALGSTMGLVDANGDLSGKLQYDAFGNVLAEENVPRSAFFKYVGAYRYMPEPFEDMLLLWHRWYDPTVGRFVGRDRQGATQRYSYARSLPTKWADGDGMNILNPNNPVDQFVQDLLKRELETIRAYLASLDPREQLRQWRCECEEAARRLAEKAYALADSRYPKSAANKWSNDAFRHCYWSCLLTQEKGASCAWGAGVYKEGQDKNSGGEHIMDLHNNAVGRSIGKSGGDCGDGCSSALTDGRLMPAPWTPPTLPPWIRDLKYW